MPRELSAGRQQQFDHRVEKRIDLVLVVAAPLGVEHHAAHIRGGQLILAREQRRDPVEKRVDLRLAIAAREDAARAEPLAPRAVEPPAHLAQQLPDLAPPCLLADLLHARAPLPLVEDLLEAIHGGVDEAGRVPPALQPEGDVPDLGGAHRVGGRPILIVGGAGSFEEGVHLLGAVAELAAGGQREGARALLGAGRAGPAAHVSTPRLSATPYTPTADGSSESMRSRNPP